MRILWFVPLWCSLVLVACAVSLGRRGDEAAYEKTARPEVALSINNALSLADALDFDMDYDEDDTDSSMPPMGRYVVDEDTRSQFGAACLDGSPPSFYYRPASDNTSQRFIVFLAGGGWCSDVYYSDNSFDLCSARTKKLKGTSLGDKDMLHDLGGLLSANPMVNPDFSSDHQIRVNYCDGSSYTSERDGPVLVDGTPVYLRGRANLKAVLHTLIHDFGLREASEIILGGVSAGGLGVLANLDFVAHDFLPSYGVNATRVVGVADAGLFLDIEDKATGQHPWGQRMAIGDALWGTTDAGNTNKDCLASRPKENSWQCLLGQYLLPHIRTPLFVLNSDVDLWSLAYILGIPDYRQLVPHANVTACNAETLSRWRQSFRDTFVPLLKRDGVGAFINTCTVHTQVIGKCKKGDYCTGWIQNRVLPSGLAAVSALHSWYFGRAGKSHIHLDQSEIVGGNPTCLCPGGAFGCTLEDVRTCSK